jgi:transcriptional regulator with GAF, ATPase, and Fis domain
VEEYVVFIGLLVAAAVANILANEEVLAQKRKIEERERENSLLLSISHAIASIHKKEELLKVIFRQIQPLFGFYDIGLSIISCADNTVTDWSALMPDTSPSEVNQALHEAALFSLPYRGSAIETISARIEKEGRPVILPISPHSVGQFPDFKAVLEIELAHGYREMWFTNLKAGGRLLGTLNFNSLKPDYFQRFDPGFFQAIADQVAIAVSNVLANEEILEREREKEALLSVTEAMAKVRNREELFSLILQKVQPLFGFNQHANIAVCQPGSHSLRMFFTRMNPQEQQASQIPRFMDFPIEGIFQTIVDSPEIVITDESWKTSPKTAPIDQASAQIWRDLDFKYALSVALRSFDRLIGTFHVHFYEAKCFTLAQLRLFQAIADQIASAVANILANEEILEREREKTHLLQISEAVATIRNQEDLLVTILDKITPLIGASHLVGLFTVTPDGAHYQTWFSRNEAPQAAQAITAANQWLVRIDQDPMAQDILWHAQGAYFASLPYFQERYPGHPGVEVMQLAGMQQALIIPLRVGGKVIGCVNFHSEQADWFSAHRTPLYQAIADQVAVAVANILASEKILEREREKALLLSLSEDMATIRDRDDLLKVILTKIKPLVGFDDAVISTYSEDYLFYKHFVTLSPPETRSHPLFDKLVGTAMPVKGNPDGYTLAQIKVQEVVRWDTDDIIAAYPDHFIGHFLKEIERHYNFYLKLSWGGRIIGFMHFHFRQLPAQVEAKCPLFKSIADQIAVAVANILANEEILAREREKSLQVALTNALTVLPTWEERFGMVAHLLHEAVPFDLLTVSVRNLTRPLAYGYLKQANGRLALHTWEDFGRKTGLELPKLLGHRQQLQEHFTRAGLYVGGAHESLCRRYVLKGLLERHYGMRSSVVIPLEMESGAEGDCVLTLFSRQPEGFTEQQFVLLQELDPQIALATEKGLAYEDIQAREREKALQVALTDALTEGSPWDKKFLQVVRLLAPHLPFDYVVLGFERPGGPGNGYSFSRTGPDEYQLVTTEDFFRLARLTPEQYGKLRSEINYSGPLLLNGDEFARFCRQHKLKRLIADTFRLQSNLVLPTNLGRKSWFILSLFSRQPVPYGPHHLELLRKMQSSLALVLDKLLAYEEIETLSEQLKQENTYLQEEVQTQYNFGEIVGESQSLRPVLKGVSLVAPTDATVLVLGETGTGKELVARAVHGQSKRKSRPVIKLNCAALPTQLIESELFGHEKGAFTGATERRIGKFELAKDGTIFLDEIGELPLESQCKLLRVLQEGEFERLGGNNTIKANVRVIAATNRDLEREVAEGRFRADLYFRLSIFPLRLPPLRERREDIPLLAAHFVRKSAAKLGRHFKGIAPQALQEMMEYGWPGNIRELEHVLEQAMIVSTGKLVELARPLLKGPVRASRAEASAAETVKTIDDNARDHILKVLKLTNGRVRGAGGAAELLDINPTTLDGRMRKLGITKEHIVRKP